MNVFVMVDMEGISGICCTKQSHTAEPEHQRARTYLAWDVNACVEGCLAGGARRSSFATPTPAASTSPLDLLDPRAEYVQGSSARQRMPDIASFDGLILIGYHAMAGTPGAVIDHTWSYGWQNFYINGRKSGEIALEAGIAGDNGVPILMVSGDDKACAEAKALLKDVITVQVKKGLDAEGAQLLSKDRAHQAHPRGRRNRLPPVQALQAVQVRQARYDAAGTDHPRPHPEPPRREGHRRPHLRSHSPHGGTGPAVCCRPPEPLLQLTIND